MTGKPKKRKAETILPEAYPQPVARQGAPGLVRKLRDRSTAERAMAVVQQKSESLREVIRRYVSALEAANADLEAVYAIAHEMRGLAASAGLAVTGRIADGLFRYLDEVQRAGAAPDRMLIALHISAIARAAHAENEAGRMSEDVARELAMLVKHKLADLK